MPVELYFHPEVRTALNNGKPVIALESTLITHGLPKPDNIQVAQALEAAIREQGAVPATIAILEGQITVGLTPEQLVFLGSASNVRKCSRRDLPLAVARKENGATTVAGTMIVAHWVGIRVFATGGIGGVQSQARVEMAALGTADPDRGHGRPGRLGDRHPAARAGSGRPAGAGDRGPVRLRGRRPGGRGLGRTALRRVPGPWQWEYVPGRVGRLASRRCLCDVSLAALCTSC